MINARLTFSTKKEPLGSPLRKTVIAALASLLIMSFGTTLAAGEGNSASLFQPLTQTEADQIANGIYSATGFGNTFLVVTEEGNVVIDTSIKDYAAYHKNLLDKVDAREPSYVIITHAHADHIGGLNLWTGEQTKVVMQEDTVEFQNYQQRLKYFFARRNAAQFLRDASGLDRIDLHTQNYAAEIAANELFADSYDFSLGDLTFKVISTPSETHDALSVWIPERKAVFTGDLFYRAFPNLYTLRGTKPRWALDYVESINKVLALQAEILIPSHGEPIYGAGAIKTALEQYRDLILYVHDAVVYGMNQGKSVEQLLDEISVPEELYIPEIYGRLDWSIRGIYSGYAGWFDGNPSSAIGVSSSEAYAALVELAGGADVVSKKGLDLLEQGEQEQALAIADIVLSVEPKNAAALSIRATVFKSAAKDIKNPIAVGWLRYGIQQATQGSQEPK